MLSVPQQLRVRFHGRGGQGVVTGAELLAMASFREGHYAQAFPAFGSERAGAPVTAFCRIAPRPIRTHSPIVEPDVLIVQDVTLLHDLNLFAGLVRRGSVLINTPRSPDELGLQERIEASDLRVVTVGATELALSHVGRPVPNAVLLGGFAAMEPVVSLDALLYAIAEKFPPALAKANCAAAVEAFRFVTAQSKEHCDAAAD